MTTQIPVTSAASPSAAPVTINRLASVEEELIDRICRERDGERIYKFCRELSVILIRSYSDNDGDIGEIGETLGRSLMQTLQCSHAQAMALIELSLDLVHAKLHGTYRRSNVDLGFLMATVTGTVMDVSAN